MFGMGETPAGQVRSYGRGRALQERSREIDERIGVFSVPVCEEGSWRRMASVFGERREETKGVFGGNWKIGAFEGA